MISAEEDSRLNGDNSRSTQICLHTMGILQKEAWPQRKGRESR